MGTDPTVDILNELLMLEQRSLAPRLLESTAFADNASAGDLANVHRIAQASQEHSAWLANMVISLDGVPSFPLGDLSTADMHYLDIRYSLPQFIADREALIQKYQLANGRITDEPRASDLIQRILQRHRQELDLLSGEPTQESGAVTA